MKATSYSKLTPPDTAHIQPRERLFNTLDQMLNQRCIWIVGPPGAGKSTLVASYLAARPQPSQWIQIDSGDMVIPTFFYYLREAAIAQFPECKPNLQLLTPEYLGDLQGFSRRFFRHFFACHTKRNLWVLDDFQEAAHSTEFCNVILTALTETPPQSCVIIISRVEPPAGFARLLANQCIALLTWDALKMNAVEINSLAGELAPAFGESLLQLTQGWVAGLVLLLEYIRQKGSTALPQPESLAHQTLFEYFAGEIFDTFSAKDRASLLRLGLFSSFSAQSARQMTDEEAISLLLERLIQHRLFIDRSYAPLRYDFHPLFREFLRSRANEVWTERELTSLRLKAAALSEQDGAYEAALRLFAEAGAWMPLTQLINRLGADMLGQGRYLALSDWIERLPADILSQQPWMLYWKAMAELPFDPQSSRTRLIHANALFKQQNDIMGRFYTCTLALRSFYMEWSDAHGVDDWLPEMEALYREYGTSLSADIEAQVLSAGIGIFYRQPAHPLMPVWADRAMHLISQGLKFNEQTPIADFILVFYLHKGDLNAANQALQAILNNLNPNDTAPLTLISLAVFGSIYAVQTADHDTAIRKLQSALCIAEAQGIRVFDAVVYGLLVHAYLSAERPEDAETTLCKMESLKLSWRRMDTAFAFHLRSGLCLLKNDSAGALLAARASMNITRETGTPLQHHFGRIGLIHALIGCGDFASASEEIGHLYAFAESMPSHSFGFYARFAESHLLLKSAASEDRLIAIIADTMAHGRQFNFINTHPFWLPSVMTELCALALKHGIETEYVTRLIRLRRLRPPFVPVEVWPWPIKIYTLGRFSLLTDDRSIQHTGKAQKKSLELLKAIIALGGRHIPNARLADLLWPDAEGAAARSAFDMALHRLRKLLGYDEALLLQEGKVSLNPVCCWVDIWCLERWLNELETLLKTSPIPENRLQALTDKALRLYQGKFLANDCDQPWAFNMSEKLSHKLLRQIKAIGAYWQNQSHFSQAEQLFERLLEQDPLAEEFYRLLMLCHEAAGNHSEAIETYHRCRTLLARLSNSSPSEATEILYRQLVNSIFSPTTPDQPKSIS